MLAYIDRSIPKLLNTRGEFLLITLGILAFLVSPLSPVPRKVRDNLVLLFPPGIFIYFFLFQTLLISLKPGIIYYLSPNGIYAWIMNSGICWAFGSAFSLGIMRTQEGWRRSYGRWSLIGYILMLLLSPVLMPAVMTT